MTYGWIPDLPDKRDYKFRSYFKLVPLPPKVDLRPQCSPVEQQGTLGSCTAQATVGAMEFLESKRKTDLSRLFLYYNTRLIEGTVGYDSGAMIRDAVKSAAETGVCIESLWPYCTLKYKKTPKAKCYINATTHKSTAYLRIENFDELKSNLAEGYPVVFGFTVYASFESLAVATTGQMPMPQPNEKVLGGHAVLAVGYDDSTQCLIVRNSWGPTWGDHGYFYMPYAYAQDTDLSSDFWTIREINCR